MASKYLNFRYALSLAAGVAILIFIFKKQDVHQLWTSVKSADFGWIIFGKIFILFSHYIRALRWKLFFKTLKSNPSASTLFSGIITGYFVNLFIPRAGELTKCSYVSKKENISFGKIMGTLGAERFIDFLSLWIILSIVLIFRMDSIIHFVSHKIHLPYKHILILLTVALVVLALFLLLIRRFKHMGFVRKIIRFFLQLKRGFLSILKIDAKERFLFFIYTLLIWSGYAANIFFTFKGIDYTTSVGFFDAYFILLFSGFSMLAPIQGGIGAYHWMVTQGLMLLGLNYSEGLISATILHASNYFFTLILGILFFTREIIIRRKSKVF